ncbi:hypothetical protein AWC38_SpisGene10896 [Paramuricea clavata]|uniref:Tyr recombinase domain-containing protein n=2 Tax=Paramuricea clavata TaxID=317549 RepID=A0A7D9JH52_PARCT|nr:hypothetical protein AWC38_SpisGene10896 [Paramuricea clavata]
MSLRAALDRHLRSPPYNKKFSICDLVAFQEANKTLHSYLKHLMSTGKIAGTVHKNPLTPEAVQLLFEKGELACAETRDPRCLMQTVWFYISLYFGKRGRENQRAMKKSMLRLCTTGTGEEYFELNKDEPGTMLSSKNHTGGLEGTEDHSDGKVFALTKSPRCPVNTIKAYLSHLNPDIDVLFQRPRHPSSRFNRNEAIVWYEKKVLGHNMLNNRMRNMSQRAGISPYYTNHSLRATTVTVLSSNKVETRKIKAVTGHRSDTSIESYCARPTLSQFKQMSSTLSSFVHGEENTAATSSSSIIPTPVAPRQHPAESSATVANSTVTFGRNEANILQAHSVRCPESILPSGTFQGCSFTFNINMNNN